MQENIERLQLGMNTNTIFHYRQAPQSHRHFQRSVEGTQPQPNPDTNSKRIKINQNQQDNRRQQQ